MSERRTSETSRRNPKRASAVEALHRHCGVYTKPEIVRRILDAVGWKANADLFAARLLEPASGDGAFVVEAASRLVASFSRRQMALTIRTMGARMVAFELHPREAAKAQERVERTLRNAGVHHRTAAACARSWIVEGDFLLSKALSTSFTHVVGNPPYVRWSRIPIALRAKYDRLDPHRLARGDLFLPFLDRALDSLTPSGRCGFVCSDRWRYMAFAEEFRRKWVPKLKIHSERAVRPTEAFVQAVDSYPTILIASKVPRSASAPAVKRTGLGLTLEELGCRVRVGPALGHTPAYVLKADERDVEPELLERWIDGSEVEDGVVVWSGRHVILMHGADGNLVNLQRFPRLKARMARFRKKLKERSIVANGAPWYRPIDRVRATDWSHPKLLVPELARVPRIAIDRSGAVPSHGVYAIFAPDDDVAALYRKLANGTLVDELNRVAPKVKGEYLRCYRRFLLMVRVK